MLLKEGYMAEHLGNLHGCVLILHSGEFGVVYKANLQWPLDAVTELFCRQNLVHCRVNFFTPLFIIL